MELNQSDIEYMFKKAQEEFTELNKQEQQRIAKSEHSFGEWLENKIKKIARSLGYAISFPFRAIKNFIVGFWEGLFG